MLFRSNSEQNRVTCALDPYAPYRANAAKQLQELMANPSSVTSLPGYQFQQQSGTQNTEMQLANRGLINSSAEQAALSKFNQNLASSYYNDEFNRLAKLSGADQNPYNAALAGVKQGNDVTTSNNQNIGAGLTALTNIYNGWNKNNNSGITPGLVNGQPGWYGP